VFPYPQPGDAGGSRSAPAPPIIHVLYFSRYCLWKRLWCLVK